MARSKYIYFIRLVINPATVLAAFTVKHEANTWAMRSGHKLEHIQLSRIKDGITDDKDEEDIPWSEE